MSCETQEELDELWEKLSGGGEIEQCGWLKDKYGVSWQIVPSVLGEMLQDKDAKKSARVMEAMLKMEKIDIAALKQAYGLEDRIRHELPHLTDEDTRSLACVVERLIEAYQPTRIYLFGSKARGDYGPDSDFDLMVVVPTEAPETRKHSKLAYEQLWGTGVAADVLVWTHDRFASRAHLRASLPGTILREGKVLYAA